MYFCKIYSKQTTYIYNSYDVASFVCLHADSVLDVINVCASVRAFGCVKYSNIYIIYTLCIVYIHIYYI